MSHFNHFILFATQCNCFLILKKHTGGEPELPVDFRTIANKKEEMNSNNFKHIFTPHCHNTHTFVPISASSGPDTKDMANHIICAKICFQ